MAMAAWINIFLVILFLFARRLELREPPASCLQWAFKDLI